MSIDKIKFIGDLEVFHEEIKNKIYLLSNLTKKKKNLH